MEEIVTTGRFTEDRMRTALHGIAGELGISSSDAEILHMANNATFALPGAGVVIRISRSNLLHDRAHKGASLGAWFETVNAPTIRLAGSVNQPVEHDGFVATVWEYVPPNSAPDADDLGQVLREFHSLPAPDFDLPHWDPIGTARKRIADAEGLEESDRRILLDWCAQLEPEVTALLSSSTATLIHGDAHVGNLLRKPDGRVILCDFDSTCLGPSGVDLAAVAAAEIWFPERSLHERLSKSYGQDITTDRNWQILRETRELTFVVGGVPLMASTPGVASEFKLRLNAVLTGDTSVPWTPYAEFGQIRG